MNIERVRAGAARALRVGPRGVLQRVAARLYRRTGARDLEFHLASDDMLSDIPDELPVPAAAPERGTPLTVGWVMSPPTIGSGGHTTLFRMIEGLEARGYRCVVFVYDKHGTDLRTLTQTIRRGWPRVRASVRDARGQIGGVDAVVASSWESAHVVARRATSPMRRLYFVQDFEPYFYGHGAEYELAAMTYRLPMTIIALGEMLGEMLHRAAGVRARVVPFGCDSSSYAPPAREEPRSGIVFFSRPDVARRGYLIARAALELFERAHPEQPIHVYGSAPTGLSVPHVFHGRLTVPELNALYGRTIGGLAMSFSNITLVAEEMLAAGNIPVVNDLELAHLVLPNPHVVWAQPTPGSLARALGAVVSSPDIAERAAAAASSVVGRSWEPTIEAVLDIIEEEVYRA